jgi:hypothetical protein
MAYMSEGYSIEVAEELVGVVVREQGERYFTFFTAVKAFNALDGRTYRNALDAERAARAHMNQRKQKRPAPKRAPHTRHSHQTSIGASNSGKCVWSTITGL